MDQISPEPTVSLAEPTTRKRVWSRPAFETLQLERTLNNSSIVSDSTSDSHS